METASILLVVIGLLGAFDVAVFHMGQARLTERPECRREAWIHVARAPVYAMQFILIPNVALRGAWAYALFALFAIDAVVAALDVLAEPEARRSQGGLSAGEYFMHVLLSVLVGAMLHSAMQVASGWRSLPTALMLEPHGPTWLRLLSLLMATGVVVVAIRDVIAIARSGRAPKTLVCKAKVEVRSSKPIHVSVRIPTTVEALWNLTQDHHIHPDWDHRFDKIVMLSSRIETGTRMHYEKTVLGCTISGWGRYKLHRAFEQSTFEFGSDDVRSLIRRGVGLWRYRPLVGGIVEFSTSYTYEVRWGTFGRLFDRWVFRPLFQYETERSFRRLANRYFGVKDPHVLGAAGAKPARFDTSSVGRAAA